MDIFTDNFWKTMWNTIRRDCPRIEVKPGKCRFNFKCHHNAYHEAYVNDHDDLVACWYKIRGYKRPSIHFVNWDGTKYVDNSIGYLAEHTDYYRIRTFSVNELRGEDMDNVLMELKEAYQCQATFFQKLFGCLEM